MLEKMNNSEENPVQEREVKRNKFYNSRLFIMVFGFFLTGIVGGTLTHYWHKKEFEYKTRLEQEYSKIRAHSESWENLYNKIFNQTSEYVVAVNRIISMYKYTIVNPEHQREIIANFNSVSNKWERESVIIRSQLRLLFFQKESQQIIISFENEWNELMSESELLNKQIADLVTKYNVTDKSPRLTQLYNECQKLSINFVEKVYNFGNHLIFVIFPK